MRATAYWVPLDPAHSETMADGARLLVFGRVADRFSLADARAELAAVSDRMARAFPQTHADVRLQVVRYTQAFAGSDGPGAELALRSFQLGTGILLLIVAVNVAILIYVRTATRTGEVVMRTALGEPNAYRLSLFVEALVLTRASAVVGLGIVAVRDVERRWNVHVSSRAASIECA